MSSRERNKPNPDVAKKLVQALTASSDALFQLVLNANEEVLFNTLKNPHLSEEHLLALLKRRDLSTDLLDRIHQRCSKTLSHRLILALIKNPATSDFLARSLMPHLRLFELVDVCFLPGAGADKRLAAERNILQRLPTAPLGNKLTLARRATANIVGELLKEGHPTLTEICLSSPRLKEASIYQFLTGPKATAETISMIARHQRWQHRTNLRQAILRNQKTPDVWFTLWLPNLSLPIIKQMFSRQRFNASQKHLIQNELKKRCGG